MTKLSLPLTQLIHKNLSVLMTFCFSRNQLERLVETKFIGEWKYLRKGLFEVSEKRAEKACLELAMFLRLLDDTQQLSDFDKHKTIPLDYGKLIFTGKPEQILGLRDVCNKIIHASVLQWDFSDEYKPKLICTSREPEKWLRAEIDIVNLATFCGELMH